MEISFVNKSANTPIRNEHPGQVAPATVTREQKLDSVSGNIRSGLKSAQEDPDQLLEQTVEASAQEGAIDGAHDFNMARIMELLSDPLLQEDVPE
ncbi:hypothetical protein [Desulfovibrio sp. JC022]|uniref:hypothetical protein n=1 Tax=Desulfovibrio sp. JC022 TaxID=2593642 RepID=UPI0013D2A29F|nr:hypothetical protein [Desulfovibrio sp. JC022]NDV21426.1 hypothetical protein [Desulfovibrio sp. JC022]